MIAGHPSLKVVGNVPLSEVWILIFTYRVVVINILIVLTFLKVTKNLRANTYCFEGRKCDISDEFSTCWGKSETDSLVFNSVFLASNCLENILENFVETELAETLSTISDQSWEPTLKKRVKKISLNIQIGRAPDWGDQVTLALNKFQKNLRNLQGWNLWSLQWRWWLWNHRRCSCTSLGWPKKFYQKQN